MLHADYLFLLTDVDGLYTTNPRKDPSAEPIDVVDSVQAIRTQGMQAHIIKSLLDRCLRLQSMK
jgi:glutamate 5-kinase